MKRIFSLYHDIIILTLLAVPIGAAAGGINTLFGRILLWITEFRTGHAYWLLPFLGIAGAVIVWCYQKFGGRSGRGMALIFEAGHGIMSHDMIPAPTVGSAHPAAEQHTMDGKIPLRLIPFTMAGTWLTHLFGGSAGREGVAIQIGGAIAHEFGRWLPVKHSKKLLLVTGMAAGFAGLFRTPFAAVFFAMEVFTVGVLEHRAWLPALTAAFTASYISGLLGLEKFSFVLTDRISLSWMLIPRLLLLGILFGVTGGLFSLCLHKMKKRLADWIQNPIRRILTVGTAIGFFSLLCWGGRYSGLGTNLIALSFGQGIDIWDFALKFIFTAVTLSAGFQGGEVTPLFSIGAALGAVLASVLGLPAAFAAAMGYAAVFGSATNTLIAPMLIGAEVFGYDYLPYFIVICGISYVCNGGLSIYPLQRRKNDDSGNKG